MRKFTIKKLFVGLCFALLVPVAVSADVEINETNFPDANFRNWLLEQDYGEDGIITDVEIARIMQIYVPGENISTLEGIQYFIALKILSCWDNQLTSLDVSSNAALQGLSCYSNQLTSLDVSNNVALIGLVCFNNKIKGTNMEALISSLPNTDGVIYIYNITSKTEGNVCTKSQVAKIKEKGWTPLYYNGEEWLEYEGSDDLDGIIAMEVGNGLEFGANALAYDLNGNRVEGWQSKKGVYIVGGKKIVVK